MSVFHEQDQIPLNSCLLLDSFDEAQHFACGDLRLAFCGACGFVANTAFEPGTSEYSERYEETQGFSPHFVDFARSLAKRWVDTYDLTGKKILEIGCGKGEFLMAMIEAGAGSGIGIDPSIRLDRLDNPAASKVEWIPDVYSERYSDLAVDAVVCRHTLEHIPDVVDFMTTVRRAIGSRTDTIVLFELPDVLRVLEEVAFWDVYYEHCSYFSLGSLARLFRHTGFEIVGLDTEYDDQYLVIEARPSTIPPPGAPFDVEGDLERLAAGVEHFRAGSSKMLTRWHHELSELRRDGGRAVIWGAGSKGVSFLTSLGAGRDLVEFAVDVNPFKQGKFMARTGQLVVAPEALREHRPDLVIAMNAVYTDEIAADLDRLDISSRLLAV